MPSRPVVVNNTPLVGLWNLGRLDLLTALFESVVIPSAVEKEFLAKGDPGRAEALRASGVTTISVRDTRLARGFVGVDIGEAEVLALGHQLGSSLLLIDDKKARNLAERLGYKVTGTVGVLLAAKKTGLVEAVRPLLSGLQDSGLYLAPNLIEQALLLADE